MKNPYKPTIVIVFITMKITISTIVIAISSLSPSKRLDFKNVYKEIFFASYVTKLYTVVWEIFDGKNILWVSSVHEKYLHE